MGLRDCHSACWTHLAASRDDLLTVTVNKASSPGPSPLGGQLKGPGSWRWCLGCGTWAPVSRCICIAMWLQLGRRGVTGTAAQGARLGFWGWGGGSCGNLERGRFSTLVVYRKEGDMTECVLFFKLHKLSGSCSIGTQLCLILPPLKAIYSYDNDRFPYNLMWWDTCWYKSISLVCLFNQVLKTAIDLR